MAMPEPRFPIRLLALDIDGTLVGPDLVLRPRTRAAIHEAIRRGIRVALATGRMATSAYPFAEVLGVVEPIIAFQGALVREMPASGRPLGRLLLHRPLAAEVAREAIAWSVARGLEPHINHLERFVIGADDPRADDYSAFLGARAELVPDLAAWVRRPVTKILAVGADGRPALELAAARAHFLGRAEVTVSHPQFLEFLAPGVSKGAAVRWMARRIGVPLEQVLAIGDQYNDLEMIEAVGHGVAMPSAPEPVRAVARHVAPPLEDEGAAEVIEALALAGRLAPRNAGRFRPGGPASSSGGSVSGAGGGSTIPAASATGLPRLGGVGIGVSLVRPDDEAGRAAAIDVLAAGGLVALPTDTVYGLAVALDAPEGIARLFAAKSRPPEKGIVLLVADTVQAEAVATFGPAARALALAFWPGGLTLILPRRPDVALPDSLTGGAPTIGLRVPDHESPRAIARALGPLPVTSANRSGEPEARSAEAVLAALGAVADLRLVLDGGPSGGGRPSTVVDCSVEPPRILRVGAISGDAVAAALRDAGLVAPQPGP